MLSKLYANLNFRPFRITRLTSSLIVVTPQRLPPPYTDLSPLSNPGWVHQVLSGADGRRVPEGIKLEEGAKAWPGLGKVTEVLELPAGRDTQTVDEVAQGVKDLSV
jgi:hypothetical protein